MKETAPKLDKRKASDLLRTLNKMVPHYTPGWESDEGDEKDPGKALLKIFSHLEEGVLKRYNQVPRRDFAAFLDMLGIRQQPAQPARVPLTFKLSSGAAREVLIPKRTQASAAKTEAHEALPFETEANLQAVPSPLKQVIGIDPGQDAVYLPPPGFLEKEARSVDTLTYTIVSSPAAGTKNFQLDHVTGLEEGDILVIGTGTTEEYVIISTITGNIVAVTDKLANSFPAETTVQKLDWYPLFEGKNMQEHSIYLGHKELFDVKSAANFFIFITHREGTVDGNTPLELTWEYWGEVEGEEGEDWRTFETIDNTDGLSRDGVVQLVKTAAGEIKEKEIDGQKNRWIRCRLSEPLGVDETWKLPVLDNIVFTVKSGEEDLYPDQAFNNETPLDVTVPFNPFGKEPRIFDTFSLAGKEIFSKQGAEVTLDVEVGTIGPPFAIQVGQEIRVFAVGTYGQLIEVIIGTIDNTGKITGYEWLDHGSPPNTRLVPGSTPSAILSVREISVFANAENGHLIERHYKEENKEEKWQWIDHGTPKEGVKANFDPFVIKHLGFLLVFVVGSDGNLHEFSRNYNSLDGTWIDHGKSYGISLDSSPYAQYLNTEQVEVFVKGQDGNLYLCHCYYNKRSGSYIREEWKDYGSPGVIKPGVRVDSRPFAGVSTDTAYSMISIVFSKGSDGQLWEFNPDTPVSWVPLGSPKIGEKNINVNSDPHGILEFSSGIFSKKFIFVRGSDDCLWEWNETYGENNGWKSHQKPGYAKPVLSPFVLPSVDAAANGLNKLHVFLASNLNSIIERDIDQSNWNEYTESEENQPALTPSISWEYWNNKGWVALKGLNDGTANLLESGKITFELPGDIEEIQVAGQENYWIRARIVGGDYGKETYSLAKTEQPDAIIGKISARTGSTQATQTQQRLISSKSSIRPPVVDSLTIAYELKTETYPQKCLTYNNLEYIDQTEASKLEDKHFSPFEQLEETAKTLYLGFEKYFKGGPVKIFFDAEELPYSEDKKPKIEWKQSRQKEWEEINSHDATEALIIAEILEFIGNTGFSAATRYGNYLYWLKGTLVEGEYETAPLLYGIYPNTAWTLQAETIKDEILGSSDGTKDQTFTFFKYPVRQGEEIRVREVLTEEEKNNLIAAGGEKAVTEVTDAEGNVIETWVLWEEVMYFYDSTENDRHYLIDRAIGEIGFGDGTNGMIPPAGDNNIKAFSYQAVSGGAGGNVAAGEIKTLKSSLAGVDKVTNPIAADGGADTATLDDMLEIGPAMISHRDRAVTVEDFERLAKQASRKVAKARCYPNTNNKRQPETGWVTVIIIPWTAADKPEPTLQLRRIVQKYLQARCANTLAAGATPHIYVDGPVKDNELLYVDIDVTMDVVIETIDAAAQVDRDVKDTLKAFLHPLTGGPEGNGWDFGRAVSASDIYAKMEEIDGIDHVENLKFISNGEPIAEDLLEIGADYIAANGTHTINLQVKKGG